MTNIFLYLLPLSIKACVVIPLILAIRLMLEKQPKIYSYVLWLVVFAGLVFNIKVSIAYYNPVSNLNTVVNSQYSEILDDYVNDVHIYHDNRLEYYTAIEKGITSIYYREDGTRYVVVSDMGTRPDTVATYTMPKLAFIWAAGVLVGIYCLLKNYLAFRCRIHIAEKNGDIHYTDNITTPFVYGLFKPVVCIPLEMKENLPLSVIAHEKTHIRRGDHIIKPLCMIITILHWFNPLVWLAFKYMCRDMEMSCDEAVIRKTGNKKEYSLQLLNCAVEKQPAHKVAVLFGESDAESRIKNVLSYKRPAKIISALLVCVVAVLSTACMVEEKIDEILPTPIPQTFYEQLAQLNSTETVQYKERVLVENITSKTFNDESYDSPETLPQYYKTGLAYEMSKGYKYSENQYSFAYVTGHDIKELYVCTFDGIDTKNIQILLSENETFINYAGGFEPLTDKLAFMSYLTKDEYGNIWLNITKINTEDEQWQYNTVRHPLEKETYFKIRGLRFLNENVGFMGQTTGDYHNTPQANITLDGGKTWQKLDFSLLAVPEYFTGYRSCCMTMVGNRIEIRFFNSVISEEIKEKYNRIESRENYSIISEDGGLTWAGYIKNWDYSNGQPLYVKLTDTIPVQILAQ